MGATDIQRKRSGFSRVQEYLKQLVYGGNDGIVTTFAIVAGFAGAQADGTAQIGGLAVLVFGLANLFADGVSMGVGEVLSGRATNDLYHKRHRDEVAAITTDPHGQRLALEGLFNARGMDPQDAAKLSDILIRTPEMAADLRLSYAHGLQDPTGDRAGINGLFTFISFITFGAVPLIPYLLFPPSTGTFQASVIATFLSLTALGLLRWYATRQGLMRALTETVLLGALCAAVAFGVGWLVGG